MRSGYVLTGVSTQIIKHLGGTPFLAGAIEGKRTDRFRPDMPTPAKRVYSLTLRCGDLAWFEGVVSEAAMHERMDAISEALRDSQVADQFERAFRSRIGKAKPDRTG